MKINWLVIAPIKFYQKLLSPLLPPSCRFLPTCSSYALECFETLPFLTAVKLSTKRCLKCHPFGSHGFDPVPTKEIKSSHSKEVHI